MPIPIPCPIPRQVQYTRGGSKADTGFDVNSPPADSRATDPSGSNFIKRLLTDETLEAVQRLKPLADEAGLSLAQLAVAWTLQNPTVSAAIIGATRPEQVRENVKAAGVRLDSGLMSRIDEVLDPVIIRDPARTASPPSRP